jgi:hypothetical protein
MLRRAIRNWSLERSVNIAAFPAGNHRHWPIAFFSKPDLGKADLVTHLKEQILERKQPSFFVELSILGGGENRGTAFDPDPFCDYVWLFSPKLARNLQLTTKLKRTHVELRAL